MFDLELELSAGSQLRCADLARDRAARALFSSSEMPRAEMATNQCTA